MRFGSTSVCLVFLVLHSRLKIHVLKSASHGLVILNHDAFIKAQVRAFLTLCKLKISFSMSCFTRPMLSKYTEVSQVISSWPHLMFSFKCLSFCVASVRASGLPAVKCVPSPSDSFLNECAKPKTTVLLHTFWFSFVHPFSSV